MKKLIPIIVVLGTTFSFTITSIMLTQTKRPLKKKTALQKRKEYKKVKEDDAQKIEQEKKILQLQETKKALEEKEKKLVNEVQKLEAEKLAQKESLKKEFEKARQPRSLTTQEKETILKAFQEMISATESGDLDGLKIHKKNYDKQIENLSKSADIDPDDLTEQLYKLKKDLDKPVHMAAKKNKADMIAYLVEQDAANLITKDQKGRTVLHYAALAGNLDLVKYLIKKASGINSDDMKLLSNNHNAVAKITTFINIQDNDGNTALHLSARKPWARGPYPVNKYLADYGANLHLENNKRKGPLKLAFEGGNLHTYSYLLGKRVPWLGKLFNISENAFTQATKLAETYWEKKGKEQFIDLVTRGTQKAWEKTKEESEKVLKTLKAKTTIIRKEKEEIQKNLQKTKEAIEQTQRIVDSKDREETSKEGIPPAPPLPEDKQKKTPVHRKEKAVKKSEEKPIQESLLDFTKKAVEKRRDQIMGEYEEALKEKEDDPSTAW